MERRGGLARLMARLDIGGHNLLKIDMLATPGRYLAYDDLDFSFPFEPNTRGIFLLRIHKRVIDFFSSLDVVKQITSITIEPGTEDKFNTSDS
ncbi:hypothetical protein IGI04_038420 [Brassica rapa subsp. trilocularis]|uniref:FACT complex subunit SSRP1 n=1 Tax=Brassica rapa subsp. trilocularis TaxID=1813537 RepID=A0ABQ7L113_BRACM|nr:hypothetical protein IGI04_028114 [Brassica rapa subsp. trilocularis]KAG5386950.1 hypothetical protein IGI04_038420 [Brassica rapa subsp. trilocularis]